MTLVAGKLNAATCIEEYFNQAVYPCRNCIGNQTIGGFFTYQKLPPFSGGKNSKVLVIGHSPTVRTRSTITTTLDLNKNSLLRKYIANEILTPLSIDPEVCAATNLIKCHTIFLPEDIKVPGKESFMSLAFSHCKEHLIKEIDLVKPKLIISLSERVSALLQTVFSPGIKPKKMKEIFATIQPIEIAGNLYSWIPVVHLPKAKVRTHYFPEQTKRLESIGETIRI